MSIDTKPTESEPLDHRSVDSDKPDNLKEIILDEDKQLDKEVPGSAFSLVALSYLIALTLVLAAVGAYLWLAA